MPDWIAILGLAIGIVLMFLSRAKLPYFWRNEKRMVWGDKIEVITPEAEFAPADSLL